MLFHADDLVIFSDSPNALKNDIIAIHSHCTKWDPTVVAHVLAPNRHQSPSNHHADPTFTTVPHNSPHATNVSRVSVDILVVLLCPISNTMIVTKVCTYHNSCACCYGQRTNLVWQSSTSPRFCHCWWVRLWHWKLQWRHNEPDDVSNHQPHDCLPNGLFRRRSKKTSKLRVTGLCEGNSPLTSEFPAQRDSNAENVSIWWRHHAQQKQETLVIEKV